jgi:hypothetical protein
VLTEKTEPLARHALVAAERRRLVAERHAADDTCKRAEQRTDWRDAPLLTVLRDQGRLG